MMRKEPLTIRERQLEFLRILKELDRFCTVNNLRYYMGCGTLIGAVRHKGFIPWDDDLDVFMPRPDYQLFCQDYVSKDFSIHNLYNDKAHSYNFGRFCTNRVCSLYKGKAILNFGIDVYVINGAPSTRDEQQKLMEDTFVHIRRAELLNRIRNGLVRRNLWPFKSLDFTLLNKELSRAERCFERYDFGTSEYIWPFGGGRLIMKKENYGTPIRLQFEDGEFNAPEHYHEVLSMGYGDYMQLPPEDEREPYHTGMAYYWVEGSLDE